MFSTFGRTGAPQKGAPTRGPANFCNIATCRQDEWHPSETNESDSDDQKRLSFFQEKIDRGDTAELTADRRSWLSRSPVFLGKIGATARGEGPHIFSERELAFMFAICHRPSVCLSVVCMSVTFVHPTQTIEIFGYVSMPFGTMAIYWHPCKILRRSPKGNPSVGGVKHNKGSRI